MIDRFVYDSNSQKSEEFRYLNDRLLSHYFYTLTSDGLRLREYSEDLGVTKLKLIYEYEYYK